MFSRNNYFTSKSFFMSCYFTKIFAPLVTTAAINHFNVYKLIGCDSGNIYLFKVNIETLQKKSEICTKSTIKTVECRSGVIIVNFEHILPFFLVFLLFTMKR